MAEHAQPPSAKSEPEVSVRIAPELLAMLAGTRSGPPITTPDGNTADGPGTDPGPAKPAPRRMPVNARQRGWPALRLRRDGMRPHRCNALLVARGRDEVPVTLRRSPDVAEDVVITREISVFREDGGDMLVHAVFTPPDCVPARPVYRLATLRDADDWQRFLDRAHVASCFDVSALTASEVPGPAPGPFGKTPGAACAGP